MFKNWIAWRFKGGYLYPIYGLNKKEEYNYLNRYDTYYIERIGIFKKKIYKNDYKNSNV